MNTPHQDQPLDTALAGLVQEQVLTAGQAQVVAQRLRPLWPAGPAAPDGRRAVHLIVEIAGYVGGAMVLGGMAAIVVPTWDSLGRPGQIVLALLATLLLGAGAATVRFVRFGGPESLGARGRLASTLGALAAGAAAVAAGVAVDSGDGHQLLAASLAALVVAVLGYVVIRGTPLLFAAWLAAAFTLAGVLDELDVQQIWVYVTLYAVLAAVFIGLGLLGGLATRLTDAPLKTVTGFVREPGTAGLLGGLTGLGTAETAAVGDTNGLALYGLVLGLVVGVACFGGYLLAHSLPLIVPAVLIALIVPASALANIFDSALAAGVTVTFVGLFLLVGGGVLIATRRRVPA